MMARGHESPVMSKKTWAGHRDRLERLQTVGIVLPDAPARQGKRHQTMSLTPPRPRGARTGSAHGTAASVPDPPQTNDRGQQVAIWY